MELREAQEPIEERYCTVPQTLRNPRSIDAA